MALNFSAEESEEVFTSSACELDGQIKRIPEAYFGRCRSLKPKVPAYESRCKSGRNGDDKLPLIHPTSKPVPF